MDAYLKKIVDDNDKIFENIKNISKINVGFTNSVYSADDKYIIKICNNKENEANFENEIEFYKSNTGNKYIPKMYSFYISTSNDDFSYEIIEKINGKSLYFIWHELDENKRKKVVKEIVNMMKSFHSIKGNPYDWELYINKKLERDFKKCFDLKLFSESEKDLAKQILKSINGYLKSTDFRLVHSDIHFDNIIYCNDGHIKIIDFETSLYAPIDYELDIFLRMCNNPLKYASEEAENFVKEEDYQNIEKYFKEFYPEIYEIDNFKIRHEIYNLEANLRLLPRFPENNELKNIVVKILISLKKIGVSNENIRNMILQLIQSSNNGKTRKELNEYIYPKISGDLLDKSSKVKTALTYLRRKNLIKNIGTDVKSIWVAK